MSSLISKVLLGILLILLILGYDSYASAKNLGTFGASYPIAEPDALTEIEQRAKEVDWETVLNKETTEKTVKAYRPSGLKRLPRAEKNDRFIVNMTYTLTMDIPNGEGGILYPRGYSFNPLSHMVLPNTLVFIDAGDPEQVEWFKTSTYANDPKTMLLLTSGEYFQLYEQLDRAVFYADNKILSRLQIKALPSIAMQNNAVMEVHEIAFD